MYWLLLFFHLVVLNIVCTASPTPPKKMFDQRQEGEWNVRADLENFVILLIPQSGSSSSSSSSSDLSNLSLLDFLTKSNKLKHLRRNVHKKHQQHHQEEATPVVSETEQFIESKTAPYHVDITKSRENLAKLHPHSQERSSDLIVAKSPTVSLIKKEGHRGAKALVFSIPDLLTAVVKKDLKSDIEFKEYKREKELKHVDFNKKSVEYKKKGTELKKPVELKESTEVKPELKQISELKPTSELKQTFELREISELKLTPSLKELPELNKNSELEDKQTPVEIETKSLETLDDESKHENKREVKYAKSDKKELKKDIKKKEAKKDSKIKAEKREEEELDEWKLLGAEHEQCGPGLVRDSYGICRIAPE